MELSALLGLYFTALYVVIAIPIAGYFASQGIGEDGTVYDESAITVGIFFGAFWPLTAFSFAITPLITALGKEFAK